MTPPTVEHVAEEVVCPFCREGDFDLYGLQWHLQVGYCPVFGQVDSRNNFPAPPAQESE